MTWVIVLLIAAVAFGAMAFALKMPRAGWELTGAALLVGIAGYALQGMPNMPGAPKAPVENKRAADEALIKQRQQMGDGFAKGASWMILADGLARQGQFGASAEVLRKGTQQFPQDADLWVSLGNALVGHSDGLITPAAQFAFQKAASIDPAHPGPPFFMGLALAQSGRLPDARAVWAELLERSPTDAPWRADLAARIQRIDSMLAMTDGAETAGAPVDDQPPAPGASPQVAE
ncbi:MAG: cytochrome C biosynthesis protein [Novosphingobium sp. 17-62-19]|uniref:tetratricopeptide repeat protein n=1 Tax=Novosphingobium sp. 17-62-19 TaxID=1970406 RepID=UPI000BC5CEAD|nr:tetratricopeptide repeat protein [Novosphingobium sp. 17-62-19]OYX92948.1 MAG: cytochrome C biosynthesis protein [Novosphingobium sp. 35-62-5]OZA18083.1 MAG: cytochrome C biosynthesis protein [Novosphingobium sp. 17-62-19]OZA71420.1 MAG: cytochrome C biosynthesis protein [Sphingomonadales bacterium 39-62-4]HQS95229.1 cytochrome C biosynthesis protein [Novosphingobium sp.]